MRLLTLILLVVAASAQEASGPPSAEEQARIIESTRKFALRYTATLPNFICTETMRRYKSEKHKEGESLRDTLVVDLAYSGAGERYKLRTIDGKATNKSLDRAGGIKSKGEFGSMLQQVFETRTGSQFRWERWELLNGRRVHVLAYRVDQAHSHFGMHFTGFLKDYRMAAAFHGSVFVEPETYRVLRLTYEPEGIPANWPIIGTSGVLEYGEVALNGEQYLLPKRVENRLEQRDGGQLRIDIDFSDYRKFSSEATLTFEK
jgi:hypothetical protein